MIVGDVSSGMEEAFKRLSKASDDIRSIGIFYREGVMDRPEWSVELTINEYFPNYTNSYFKDGCKAAWFLTNQNTPIAGAEYILDKLSSLRKSE